MLYVIKFHAVIVPLLVALFKLNKLPPRDIPVPIIVRLQGTNAVEAKEIIDNSGLNVHSAITLKEAAEKVKDLVG